MPIPELAGDDDRLFVERVRPRIVTLLRAALATLLMHTRCPSGRPAVDFSSRLCSWKAMAAAKSPCMKARMPAPVSALARSGVSSSPRRGEQPLEPVPALVDMAADLPEAPQPSRQPQPGALLVGRLIRSSRARLAGCRAPARAGRARWLPRAPAGAPWRRARSAPGTSHDGDVARRPPRPAWTSRS